MMDQRIEGVFGELLISPDTRGKSAPHFHQTYAIGITHFGAGTLFTMGKAWPHSPGAIVVTNPYQSHWGRPSPEGLGYCLLFPRLEWIAALPAFRDDPLRRLFDRPVIEDEPLAGRLGAALNRLAQGGSESPLAEAVNALFSNHARMAVSADAVGDGDNGQLSRLGAEAGWLSISSLAAEAGLSRAYHSRLYRRRVGLSPLDHRRQERVLVARSLIESGTSLAEAAAQAGFADQAHMTRQFCQILGITPAAYRPRKSTGVQDAAL